MDEAIAESWVTVEGLRVHCLVGGAEGSPVLLLHGGGIDSAALSYGRGLGLIARKHRVIALDWPGYGESDKPGIEYSTAYYSHFLREFLRALDLESASLVGLSMGGAIALNLALRSPHRVDRLVLVDSYGLGSEVPLQVLSFLWVHLPFVNALAWAGMGKNRGMVEWSLRSLLHDPACVTKELIDEVSSLLETPGAGMAWQSYQRSEILWDRVRTNLRPQLPQLQVPTLLLHGAEDHFIPLSVVREAQRLIPDSEVRVFPGCGHWLPRERPEEFSQAVLDFLGERGAKRAETEEAV